MASGEDQTEAIIFDLFIPDLFIFAGSVVDARFHVGNKISLCPVEARVGPAFRLAPSAGARSATAIVPLYDTFS
jgi:hypothetical protein